MSKCNKCDDKKFTWGKPVFPNGREKVTCDCATPVQSDAHKKLVTYAILGKLFREQMEGK